MKLSHKGLEFIVGFESKLKPIGDGRYQAYRCPAGVWTIYAGCTEGVAEGMIVTEAEGQAMFAREIAKHERAVERLVTVDITQAQADALISFSYNAGTGALATSTLLKKLNAGDVLGAADQFRQWTKAKDQKTGRKVVLRGLVRRRKAEAALFVSDLPGSDAMPQASTEAQPMSTSAKVTAGLAGGTAATTAFQSVPAVPDVVSQGLGAAQAWQSLGEQLTDLLRFAIGSPMISIPLVLAAVVLGYFAPKWAAKQENADA